MTRKLRSNFEHGTSLWAVRRAQWRALGLTDADMEKPKIAVVNTSSELAICFSHLDGVAKIVKEAIREAGGLPFEIRTTAPSDFIHSAGHRGNYILPMRDLITNDIEMQVEGAKLDGMICLTSCDKTVPGHLMAAARLEYSDHPGDRRLSGPSGVFNNHHVDIEEVFLGAGHHVAGKLVVRRPPRHERERHHAARACVPAWARRIPCTSSARRSACRCPAARRCWRIRTRMFDVRARSPAARIVEMVEEDLLPRAIMTPDAFANAAMAVLAVAGSINCIKHLQATAIEAGSDLDFYKLFEELTYRCRCISAVRPIGESSIEAFEAAGGALGVMKQLEPMHRQGCAHRERQDRRRKSPRGARCRSGNDPAARPAALSDKAGIVLVRGNLASDRRHGEARACAATRC